MTSPGFLLSLNLDPLSHQHQRNALRFRFPDGTISAPAVAFETVEGRRYSLVPDKAGKWFELVDFARDHMTGHPRKGLASLPSNAELHHVGPVVSITTMEGERILTLLHTAPDPRDEAVHEAAAAVVEEVAEYLRAVLNAALHGEPIPSPPKPAPKRQTRTGFRLLH